MGLWSTLMIIESSTITAASLLRPYISEQNYWVLQHHEVKLNKLMLMRKRQMEVMVVLAFNFCITVHLKPRWNQIPFLDRPDPILLLIVIMITIEMIMIMIINPCCRSSRPSTMGKPVGLTPTWGKPSGMKSVDNIRTRKHLAKFILWDPGITFFRSNPYFSACEQFCRDWDMTSFDPKYPNMQLDE